MVLVMMAEMATHQGIDLYSYEAPSGATLHTAIEFLARSMKKTRTVASLCGTQHKPLAGRERDHRSQRLYIPTGCHKDTAPTTQPGQFFSLVRTL